MTLVGVGYEASLRRFTHDKQALEQNRSYYKPRNYSTQKNKQQEEVWDTLGQPSGKYDYMVKYSPPPASKIKMKDIIPTGWDEENTESELKDVPSQPDSNNLDF